jgi:hypothetical protein
VIAAMADTRDTSRGRPRVYEPDAVRVETFVSPEMYQQLRRLAAQRGISVAILLRALVRDFLPK